MPPIYFYGNYSRYKEHDNTAVQSKFSVTKHYFSTQLPPLTMKKNFHSSLVTICIHRVPLKCTTSLCSHPLFGLCQSAPLLPFVTRQQNVMGYWWKGSNPTAIPPTSASGAMDQHHERRGTTFRAALVTVLPMVSYGCQSTRLSLQHLRIRKHWLYIWIYILLLFFFFFVIL